MVVYEPFLQLFHFLLVHYLIIKKRGHVFEKSFTARVSTPLSQNVKTTAALAVIILTEKRWSHVLGFSKGLLPRVEKLL
jgi:hypothetical protein